MEAANIAVVPPRSKIAVCHIGDEAIRSLVRTNKNTPATTIVEL